MEIRPVDWQAAIPIRHQILWPTKTPEACRVTGDETAKHFGAFIGDQLVSVISLYSEPSQVKTMRFRKFATLLAFQGQGIGRALLQHTIEHAKQAGAERLWCDARKSAAAFYQRYGFSVVGSEFIKSEVCYVRMERHLSHRSTDND